MQQTNGRETSGRDISRIIFRHRRKAVAFFALTMLAAAAYAFFAPKTYRSEAKLFVRLGRENVGLDATTTLNSVSAVSIPLTREDELNTVVEILYSQGLMEKVVDAVGAENILDPPEPKSEGFDVDVSAAADGIPTLGDFTSGITGRLEELGMITPLTSRERAVIQLQKQIGVEMVKKTNLVQVAHEGANPEISQQIVAELIDYYLDEHVRLNRTHGAHEFLEEQAAEAKIRLEYAADALRNLKNETGLADPIGQRQILLTRIGALETDLQTTKATAAATQAEIADLQTRLAELQPIKELSKTEGVANLAADGMRQQLYTLQLKEKELSSRATEQHVELELVRNQIKAALDVLEDLEPTRTEVTTGPNRAHEELHLSLLRQESALASTLAKTAKLEQQLVDERQRLKSLNDNELRVAELERELDIQTASYRKYSDSREQARIDESLERERISNINIAQPATVIPKPVHPKKGLTLVIGFALAVMGAICLALTAEFIDHSLKSADEIEYRLNVPVLTSIPHLRRRDLVLRK